MFKPSEYLFMPCVAQFGKFSAESDVQEAHTIFLRSAPSARDASTELLAPGPISQRIWWSQVCLDTLRHPKIEGLG